MISGKLFQKEDEFHVMFIIADSTRAMRRHRKCYWVARCPDISRAHNAAVLELGCWDARECAGVPLLWAV